jgi:hypothetical protein
MVVLGSSLTLPFSRVIVVVVPLLPMPPALSTSTLFALRTPAASRGSRSLMLGVSRSPCVVHAIIQSTSFSIAASCSVMDRLTVPVACVSRRLFAPDVSEPKPGLKFFLSLERCVVAVSFANERL